MIICRRCGKLSDNITAKCCVVKPYTYTIHDPEFNPKTDTLYGIEYELDLRSPHYGRHSIALTTLRKTAEKFKKLPVYITSDPTVSAYEFIFDPMTIRDYISRKSQLTRFINTIKPFTDSSSQTGNHIHISKELINLTNLYNLVYKNEYKVKAIAGRNNRRYAQFPKISKNAFPKWVPPWHESQKPELWNQSYGGYDLARITKTHRRAVATNGKRWALNYTNKNTIEARMNRSSTTPKTFHARVQLVMALAEGSKEGITEWADFLTYVQDHKNIYKELAKTCA